MRRLSGKAAQQPIVRAAFFGTPNFHWPGSALVAYRVRYTTLFYPKESLGNLKVTDWWLRDEQAIKIMSDWYNVQ